MGKYALVTESMSAACKCLAGPGTLDSPQLVRIGETGFQFGRDAIREASGNHIFSENDVKEYILKNAGERIVKMLKATDKKVKEVKKAPVEAPPTEDPGSPVDPVEPTEVAPPAVDVVPHSKEVLAFVARLNTKKELKKITVAKIVTFVGVELEGLIVDPNRQSKAVMVDEINKFINAQ